MRTRERESESEKGTESEKGRERRGRPRGAARIVPTDGTQARGKGQRRDPKRMRE